jgi:hypothetical protein
MGKAKAIPGWSVATHARDVTPEEVQRAMKAMAEHAGP